MGYRGSRERGRQEIELAAQHGELAADDARVILMLIYTRERLYQRAYDELAGLLRKYPRNYLLELDMAGMALLMKRPDQAIGIYQDVLRKRQAMTPHSAALAHLELGRTLSLMGQRGDAVAEYRLAAAAPDFAGSRDEALKLLHPYGRH